MKKPIKTLLCTTLILSAALAALTGCGADGQESLDQYQTDLNQSQEGRGQKQTTPTEMKAKNLSSGLEKHSSDSEADLFPTGTVAATDFGLRLFRQSMKEGENVLISPLSVLCALSMTANGAESETLAQMEELFGMSRQELNKYLYAYMNMLPQGEKYKLTLANSIWIKDMEELEVREDFLQTNVDWHNAEVYQAPFDDSTLSDINSWVDTNTDGMIPEILNVISPDAVMYLINALAFDAEWRTIYKDSQIHNGVFTAADGTKQDVEMMYSSEQQYLVDNGAVGFVKYYADNEYAFVALLPEEGTSLEDYAASLTGERLAELLANPQATTVETAIPKFQCEYSVTLNEILQAMGMTQAFDKTAADFTSMANCTRGSLYISRVLHKTFISVDERGTRAGAASAVEIVNESALEYINIVYLNRPFLYMLIDCDSNLPVFIGALESL